MIRIGSQVRETLADSGYVMDCRLNPQAVILSDLSFIGKWELWQENDDFAGYVVEIDGKGYEFCRSLTSDDFRALQAA